MPADHINITHPSRFDANRDPYRATLDIEKLRAELKLLSQYHESTCRNLEAIFNRIERGETADLHYPDGRVFVITGKVRG